MGNRTLGKQYADQEIIIKQGDAGNCMYVIQEGRVEVIREGNGTELLLATLEEGDFFGEMAIFEREVRSATVRAKGKAIIATDVGDVSEKVMTGKTGILVPPTDSRALARAIDGYLENPREYEQMGKLAKAFAKKKYSLKQMIDKTLLVYSEVCG